MGNKLKGSPFDDGLNESGVRSVIIRSAEHIDGIQLQYRDGSWTAFHGGSGGAQHLFHVDENDSIVRIDTWSRKHVDRIQFTTRNGRQSPVYGTSNGRLCWKHRVHGGHGELVGMKGCWGKYLDEVAFSFQNTVVPEPVGVFTALAMGEAEDNPTALITSLSNHADAIAIARNEFTFIDINKTVVCLESVAENLQRAYVGSRCFHSNTKAFAILSCCMSLVKETRLTVGQYVSKSFEALGNIRFALMLAEHDKLGCAQRFLKDNFSLVQRLSNALRKLEAMYVKVCGLATDALISANEEYMRNLEVCRIAEETLQQQQATIAGCNAKEEQLLARLHQSLDEVFMIFSKRQKQQRQESDVPTEQLREPSSSASAVDSSETALDGSTFSELGRNQDLLWKEFQANDTERNAAFNQNIPHSNTRFEINKLDRSIKALEVVINTLGEALGDISMALKNVEAFRQVGETACRRICLLNEVENHARFWCAMVFFSMSAMDSIIRTDEAMNFIFKNRIPSDESEEERILAGHARKTAKWNQV